MVDPNDHPTDRALDLWTDICEVAEGRIFRNPGYHTKKIEQAKRLKDYTYWRWRRALEKYGPGPKYDG